MPRKLRVEYKGALYHVMNRGDRREPIFEDDADRQRFVETLAECCAKTDWQVHALCLMPNHFHLVVETPKANLVAGRKLAHITTFNIWPGAKHGVLFHDKCCFLTTADFRSKSLFAAHFTFPHPSTGRLDTTVPRA